ncbi:MAG: RNA methyltransferase [Bacillota bacterium]|nr:RNA methyltransferase [Bacillota bacterium]
MKTITSLDNQIVKMTAGLSEKKYRDREQAYILEGPNMIREVLLQSGKARFIFLRAESESEEARQLAEKADKNGLAVYEVSDSVFHKLSQTENSQDILAVIEKPHISREDFFMNARSKNILVIDRVQDPGNIGTLLRTAEAAGFAGALFIKGSGDPFSPKAVRAASGSTERLPIIFAESANDALAILKTNGKKVFATAMNATNIYYEADLRNDVAIVVSNEGNGASKEILEAADEILSIPMDGKTESLNVAIASGIIMFESRRQRYDR